MENDLNSQTKNKKTMPIPYQLKVSALIILTIALVVCAFALRSISDSQKEIPETLKNLPCVLIDAQYSDQIIDLELPRPNTDSRRTSWSIPYIEHYADLYKEEWKKLSKVYCSDRSDDEFGVDGTPVNVEDS